ncbi:MAG TPA: PLP-dependent aminotransferase family protein [Solirubrobacteraceae bacterium]|nr:PLP-dependent aminotransferase family protein [Solirubrobacteraceae bacterium]
MSDIERSGERSLTQQLVDRFAALIDSGELEPGTKLPTTRALAEQAGINPLTAARVYRRLGELGYTTATVGRGTFVRARPPVVGGTAATDEGWQLAALPRRTPSYAEQMLQESFRAPGGDDVIVLSSGWPDPASFPREAVEAAGRRVLAEHLDAALHYQPVEGVPALREAIAEHGARHGFAREASEIVVTTGARQAVDLAARALLEPGDVAVVESPTFTGTVSSLEATGARVLPMPVDADGPDVEAIARVLARHEVKLVALQTSCQNPTGAEMSAERRERLLALARERSFFVVEDAVYAGLRFDGPRVRALRAEAPAHVVHVESLSKTVAGGLRVGWIAAQGPVLARLAHLKMNSDLHSPALTQLIAAELLRGEGYDEHVRRSAAIYRGRRDAMIEALERHLGDAATWTVPAGGHNLWVTLDRPVDERLLYAEALREGVTFLPGGATQVEPAARTSLRLSFSIVPPERFDEAARRLARALRAVHRRARVAATGMVS